MRMRVRTVLSIVVAVNVLWGAAFFGYVHRSTTPVVKNVQAPNRVLLLNTNPPVASAKTNPASAVAKAPARSNSVPQIPSVAIAPVTNAIHVTRPFNWEDVTKDIYPQYITNLRAVGCPEKQVRNIVVADVNDLFDKRRLEYAIKTDSQWWKADTYMGILPMQNFASANFDEERRALLTKLLGESWEDSIKLPSLNGSAVNLTGPVLGALPADAWNSVQEICARSMDRYQAYMTAKMNGGGAMDNIELAKLRDQTRSDLSKILTPEQMEEFLLRYSHNSSKLRLDMRGLDLTPDEFRKIFRGIDPFEHQMQVEYGGPEALSQKQREQLEAQRDRVVKEALSPQRYEQYLATKDPLYKQAQMTAMQYGMNGNAVKPLYELQKNIEAKRVQISQNSALSPEQRTQALQSLSIQHQQTLQRMLGDISYRR